MWLRNNSKQKWEDYNCGNNVIITIEPESEFEVDDNSAKVLLKNLGHENWLVQLKQKEETKE